jgi:lipopolysaccharide biosynthesis glycosyltransferase
MQNKKDMAITLGASGNMAFAAANVLMQLKKYSPNLANDVIIFQQGMSEKDMRLMQTIMPCRFIEYEFKRDIDEKYIGRFTPVAFSRYDCFDMLDEYRKILWLDIDILIQKDITEMCSDTSTGACFSQGYYPVWTVFKKKFDCPYDLDRNYYDSGTFIIQDKIQDVPRYREITNWLYDKTIEYAQYLHLPDQGVINLMLQEFNLDITPLNREAYVCHPTHEMAKDAVSFTLTVVRSSGITSLATKSGTRITKSG